jgi:hypothetical protein
LNSGKWNKNPRDLVGAKCISEIFGLKLVKEKRRKQNGAVNTTITSRP